MAENRFVIPGEFLGTEEEFTAGDGTFTDSEGAIRAALCGEVREAGKTISVRAIAPALHKLAKGDVVFARVEQIYEPVALLQVTPVGDARGRQGPTQGYSVIHASRIKPGYVELVRDELRIGDIVKAMVEEIRGDGEIALSTKPAGMGVIKAYCSRCRGPLSPKGARLECGNCGNVERRHVSRDYRVA